MPIIGTQVGTSATGAVTISFTDTDTGTTTGDVKTVILESGNLFTGLTFPAAGTYVYEFTERPNTNSDIDDPTNINERLSYSGGKYTMTVIVMNAPDGGLYIGTVETIVTVIDNDGQTVNTKVDPTPETERTEETHGDALNSEMVFTNTYIKQNGIDDPEDPDPTTESTLTVNKTVTGALGNKTTAYFEFEVTVKNNSLVTTPTTYNAYILENGSIVDVDDMEDATKNNVTASGVDDNGNSYITFTVGTEKTIFLKHGQSLVFIDTPVGTVYDVKEVTPAGYEPSFVVKSNNVQTGTGSEEIGDTIAANNNLVGELLNEATFTNNRDYTAPTGLSMSDLPFVGLIVLAVGAFVTFIVVRTRKAKKANG
jgi:hypothetical protein